MSKMMHCDLLRYPAPTEGSHGQRYEKVRSCLAKVMSGQTKVMRGQVDLIGPSSNNRSLFVLVWLNLVSRSLLLRDDVLVTPEKVIDPMKTIDVIYFTHFDHNLYTKWQPSGVS